MAPPLGYVPECSLLRVVFTIHQICCVGADAKLIPPSVVSERLKVNGCCARQAICHLKEKWYIASVGDIHHAMMIYTRKIATRTGTDPT